jgi:AbrB family looped-hinge helix DNA binding protein
MNIYTSVIRNRGQLTIPDKIRESYGWTSPNSVVNIISNNNDEIVIRPHRINTKSEIDWDKLWEDIQRVRSYKGKGRGNLSKFIAEDRQTRR